MSCTAGNNDIITLKADDTGEMLTLMYEDPKADRVSGEWKIKGVFEEWDSSRSGATAGACLVQQVLLQKTFQEYRLMT